MSIFNNLCKQLLINETEKKKGTHVYIDTKGKTPQMSIRSETGKNKIPLNLKKLNNFIIESPHLNTNKFHCQFEYTNGNLKLGKDTIIVNMGAATDCPSARAKLCELYAQGLCYANNQERGLTGTTVKINKKTGKISHGGILPAKRRHGKQWKDNDAHTIALSLVGIITSLRAKRPIKYVRMNEAGDFATVEDIEKLKQIILEVNKLLDKPVIFYNYTHRSDLFPIGRNPLKNLPNFVLQGSGYRKDMSVKPSQFELGKLGRTVRPALTKKAKKVAFMIDNCFYALEYSDFKKVKFGTDQDANEILPYGVTKEQVVQCPGSCLNCDQCKTTGNKFIVIVIHGTGAEAQTNIQQTTGAMARRVKTNTYRKNPNNLPLEDDEITKLYTSIGRNDYSFIEKLYDYYLKANDKDKPSKFKFTEDDIENIWDRLIYLRSITKNSKEFQAKDWISPNTTGKSKLEGSVQDYILKLQNKNTPLTESMKKNKLDLMKLINDPVTLANLAVSGILAKIPTFVSPKDIEDEMAELEETKEIKETKEIIPPSPSTDEILKNSYNVQRKLKKLINENYLN